MIETGRLCVKLAGRDAGKKCVIIERIDDNFVMIDGQTRRKKCNVKHLEPLEKIIKIKEGASHAEVAKELQKEGIEVKEKAVKQKKEASEKPKKEPAKKAKAKTK